MSRRVLLGLVALAAVLGTAAWRVGIGNTSSKTRPALAAVSLPDLTAMEPSARHQLQEGYSLLETLIPETNVTTADLATGYGRVGTLLMAAEYYQSAEPFLINASRLQSTDLRWVYYLAHVYRATNQTQLSADFFERATRLDSRYEPTWAWLGDAYLDLGLTEMAERSFDQLRSLNSGSAAALFGLGRVALARRDYAGAIAHLTAALSLDQHSAGIKYSLAMAYRGIGDTEQAERHLQESGPRGAMGLADPLMQELDGLLHSSQAFRATAVWTFNRGEREAAVEYFKRASELAHDEPSLQYEVGVGLFLAGDNREAILRFQDALRLSPTFAKAHYGLGMALARGGDMTQALQHLSAAVSIDPDYLEAQLARADLLRRLGQFDQAIHPYERVLELDPRLPEATLGYALSLGGAGRREAARVVLRDGVARFPDRPEFMAALENLRSAH